MKPQRLRKPTTLTDIDAKAYETIEAFKTEKNHRRRSRGAWTAWTAYCSEHAIVPTDATTANVTQFLDSLSIGSNAVKEKKRYLFLIYEGLGIANPARSERPLRRQNTTSRKLTDADWRHWVAWCEQEGFVPMPAQPEQLVQYLSYVTDIRGDYASIRTATAIARRHKEAGEEDPRHRTPLAEALKVLQEDAQRKGPRSRKTMWGQSPGTLRYKALRTNAWAHWCSEQGISPDQPDGQDVRRYVEGKDLTWSSDYTRRVMLTLTDHYGHERTNTPFLSMHVRTFIREKQERETDLAGKKEAKPEPIGHLRYSKGTRQRDVGTWGCWSKWCAENQVAPLEATPRDIIAFINERAQIPIKISTIQADNSSLTRQYSWRTGGTRNPAASDLVRDWIQVLRKERPESTRKVSPLREKDYQKIKNTALQPRDWETEEEAFIRGTVTIAALGLQRDCLMRVGELAAARWDALTPNPDGSGLFLIRRSKTDQTGQGAQQHVTRETMRWLKKLQYVMLSGDTIFGKGVSALRTMIRDAAKRASLEGEFSGHSARIGMTQDLTVRGYSTAQIMHVARWKTETMVAEYTRDLDPQDSPIARMEKESEKDWGYATRRPVVVVVIRNTGDSRKYY